MSTTHPLHIPCEYQRIAGGRWRKGLIVREDETYVTVLAQGKTYCLTPSSVRPPKKRTHYQEG